MTDESLDETERESRCWWCRGVGRERSNLENRFKFCWECLVDRKSSVREEDEEVDLLLTVRTDSGEENAVHFEVVYVDC